MCSYLREPNVLNSHLSKPTKMTHYIIDGNNLIGKIKTLRNLKNSRKQESRSGLAKILNDFFAGKKIKLTLHFDGYPEDPVNLSKGRIEYSNKKTSDEMIRNEIDNSKNPKLITLITSDHSLQNYGRVNSCKVIKSEDFARSLESMPHSNEESRKIKELEKESEIFLELFNLRNRN